MDQIPTSPLIVKSHRQPALGKCYLACTAISILLGISLATCTTYLISAIVKDLLPMKGPSSMLFQSWQDSNAQQLPLLRNFYVFNLTNPFEVFERSEIPNVVKIGPYVYREHLYAPMESVAWSEDLTELTFNYFSDFEFAPELSVDPILGPLDEFDNFTTLNLALWAAAYRLSNFPVDGNPLNQDVKTISCGLIETLVNHTVLGDAGFFIRRSVHDFLFGFRDIIWTNLQDTTWIVDYECPSMFKTVFNHSQPAPSPYSYRSGLTCPVWDNESLCNSSGVSTCKIYTGVGNVEQVAQYSEWAGQNSLWWWSGETPAFSANAHELLPPVDQNANETCTVVRGSNAMNYPPGLTEEDHPYIFVDSIFRSIKLQFTQTYKVGNVPTLQFRISDDEKVLGTPNCRCYDMRYPAVFNVSRPYFAPMLATQPYFWGVPNSSAVFVDEPDLPTGQRSTMLNFTVNGTHINELLENFDPEDAELVLRIEPTTGVLLQAMGRVQLATWLRPIVINDCPDVFPELRARNISGTNDTSYFPYTMFPVMYLDRTVTAPAAVTDKLFNLIVLPVLLGQVVGGVMAGLAATIFVIRCVRRGRHPDGTDGNLYHRPTSSAIGMSSTILKDDNSKALLQ